LIYCWKFIWYSTSILLFRLLKRNELSLKWKMKNDWSIDGLTFRIDFFDILLFVNWNFLRSWNKIFKILNLFLEFRHRHKTSNPPELLEFIKYNPFLIFWCIFCRNLWKIGYENEVCFEACRIPNLVWLFYDSI
jgi:hypothetical protein